MPRDAIRFLAVNRVKAGREQEYEAFVREVIVPVTERLQPHLAGNWQALRPAQDQTEGAISAYGFAFYGDASLEDWDLERMWAEADGDEEASKRMRQFTDLIDGEQTVYGFGGELPLA